MQYFVSAENTSYHYWQLELLIESFKINNLENDLYIFLAENDNPKIKGFSKNLINHKNRFQHENFGREHGCLSLNRPFALFQALGSGCIKPPFAIIHTDMILRKPINDEEITEDIVVDSYTSPLMGYGIEKDIKELLIARGFKDIEKVPARIPTFGVMIFNSYVDETFWPLLIEKIKKFSAEKGDRYPAEYAAWELSFFELLGFYSFSGKALSCSLLDTEPFNFIHYKYGIPPIFNKKYFLDNNKILTSRVNPHDAMLEHNPTVNTNFLQKVINSYRKSS